MGTPVIMPMLGLTMEEGAVAEWLKHEGDDVRKDEPLFTVEMDKGIVEVPAPASGKLLNIAVAVGETVPVKTVIAQIGEGEVVRTLTLPSPAAAGEGVSVAGEGSRTPAPMSRGPNSASERRIFVSPRARRRAREHGIALEAIAGSGPRGRIVEADVLAHAQTPAEPSVQPLTRIRRITADRMAASARSVARVTLQLEADLTEAARFRTQLAPEFARLGVAKLPWDALLAKAAGLALVDHPAVNAQWVDGQGLRQNSAAHVGVAIALEPEGLVVPVLHDAHSRSLRQMTADLLGLVDKAKQGRLSPTEMQGGTFTITNLGAYRVDGFSPIINPPETAILGVGRIAEKPAVVDHRLEVRLLCTLSLSFDHRVVDGVPAAAFLNRLVELLERPYALLEI